MVTGILMHVIIIIIIIIITIMPKLCLWCSLHDKVIAVHLVHLMNAEWCRPYRPSQHTRAMSLPVGKVL